MSEVTIWSCGDLCASLELNNILRGLGFKCRVHNTDTQTTKTPWRYGQHIIVGSGKHYPAVSDESKVLFLGLAALEYSAKHGGTLMRNPPGLQHAAETLLCTTTSSFGSKRTSMVIESQSDTYYFRALPSEWKCAAMNERDKPVIAQLNNNLIVPYSLTRKSIQFVLERILTKWDSRRVNPTEYAIKKALTSARQQCTCANREVVVGYSGGLFSFVTQQILIEALGKKRVIACYIETGLCDATDATMKEEFKNNGIRVLHVQQDVTDALSGETCALKRRKILNVIFTKYCKSSGNDPYLAQGASYESIVNGVGQPALNSPGIIQPLENLSVCEVELIGKRLGYRRRGTQMLATGYSDFIRGPFSLDALALCKRINWVCDKYIRSLNNKHNDMLIKVNWELDVYTAVPRVLLWLLTSKNTREFKLDNSCSQIALKLGELLRENTYDLEKEINIFTQI